MPSVVSCVSLLVAASRTHRFESRMKAACFLSGESTSAAAPPPPPRPPRPPPRPPRPPPAVAPRLLRRALHSLHVALPAAAGLERNRLPVGRELDLLKRQRCRRVRTPRRAGKRRRDLGVIERRRARALRRIHQHELAARPRSSRDTRTARPPATSDAPRTAAPAESCCTP